MGNKICPKCKGKISYLRWSENAVRFGSFEKDGDYITDSVEGNGGMEYLCPECDEVLFTDEQEANDFLHTKIELAINSL
ncbi:hypothetical protein LCGC14_0622730 [marine sediment metagenome]|uniref:Uncharacterized protein n=1 Tax=marine sediment metagenome TaxID=412755 RepID=A0A0F9RNQ8_9ZZZZ